MKFTFFFAFALTVNVSIADDLEELTSYFDLHHTNWESIPRFDVLCRTDRMREPGLSAGYTETTFERIIADWDSDRVLYAKASTRKSLDESIPAESIETGFVLKDGRYRSFKLPQRKLSPRIVIRKETVFDDHRMPDFRILMFMKVSRGSPMTWTENKANALRIYPQQATGIKSHGIADGGIRFDMVFSNSAGFKLDFNADQLMPVRSQWYVKPNEKKKLLVVGTEQLTWHESDGVFVPTNVLGEFRDRQFQFSFEQMNEKIRQMQQAQKTREEIKKAMDDMTIDVTEFRDMRFHWISINQPIPEDRFDFTLIDDPKKFVSMTDPAVIGAKNLVDASLEIIPKTQDVE